VTGIFGLGSGQTNPSEVVFGPAVGAGAPLGPLFPQAANIRLTTAIIANPLQIVVRLCDIFSS